MNDMKTTSTFPRKNPLFIIEMTSDRLSLHEPEKMTTANSSWVSEFNWSMMQGCGSASVGSPMSLILSPCFWAKISCHSLANLIAFDLKSVLMTACAISESGSSNSAKT